MTEVKNNPTKSNYKAGTHCVVYRLHKDNSPVVIDCYSENEQSEVLQKCIKDGYKKAFRATPEQASKELNDYGNQFPKELSKQVNYLEPYSDEVKKLRKQMLRR